MFSLCYSHFILNECECDTAKWSINFIWWTNNSECIPEVFELWHLLFRARNTSVRLWHYDVRILGCIHINSIHFSRIRRQYAILATLASIFVFLFFLIQLINIYLICVYERREKIHISLDIFFSHLFRVVIYINASIHKLFVIFWHKFISCFFFVCVCDQ